MTTYLTLRPLWDKDEGWEFHDGVPDSVADGYFFERIASFGPVLPDEDPAGGPGGMIEVVAHDGRPWITYPDGDNGWGLSQARQFDALFHQALEALTAYVPKPWMLDPEQLIAHKKAASRETLTQAYEATGMSRLDAEREVERDLAAGEA